MDFLVIQWNNIDTLPEITILIGMIVAAGLAVWYVFTKKKADAVEKLDQKTIKSYKERLESVEQETKTCQEQHAKSLKLIHSLQGELKVYKELVLIPKDFIKELQRNQVEIIKLLKDGKSK